jgi:hypothetical protein
METRKIVALIAVIERINTTLNPAKNASMISGSMMRRKVMKLEAPRLNDASTLKTSARTYVGPATSRFDARSRSTVRGQLRTENPNRIHSAPNDIVPVFSTRFQLS